MVKRAVLLLILLFCFASEALPNDPCQTRELRLRVKDPARGVAEEVLAILYQPYTAGALPAVLSLASSYGLNPIDGMMASDFCAGGITTVLLEVFSQEFLGTADSLSQVEAKNRFAMAAIRAVVDALEKMPEIDADRIGLLGSSLGGIIGAMYFPRDGRLRAFANILGGEDIPEILAVSADPFVSGFRERVKARRGFRSDLEFLHHARRELVLDPAKVTSARVRDQVLQVMLEGDTSVPYPNQLKLWLRSGEPRRILLSGRPHADAFVDFVMFRFVSVLRFFERMFNTPRGRGTIRTAVP